MRWDVKAQVLLLPLKWSFLFLFLLAPLAVMVAAEPYRAFRLVVSETATTSSQVTNRKSGKNSSYEYTYVVDGKTYYSSGSGYARDGAVTYVVSRPKISRLEGHSDFIPWLIMLPLLAAYVLALRSLQQGLRKQSAILRILGSGECAQASISVLDVVETRDGKKRYNMEFSFTPSGASEAMTVAVRTSKPGGLGDEHTEDILYDLRAPQRPVFLDSLPGKVNWHSSSGWVSRSPHMTVLALLLPLAALWAFLKACQLVL